MKLIIEQAALLKSLSHVQNVVERRNTIPILSNVKLSAKDGRLDLNATDMDIDIVADDLDYSQMGSGQDFQLETLHLWVDAEHYVPLKMRFDGIARIEGDIRDMRIERENGGYGTVTGCGSMYAPVRTVMRMSGVLSESEQAELQKAQDQLDDMKTATPLLAEQSGTGIWLERVR